MCFTDLDWLYSIQFPIIHPSVGGADRAIEDSSVPSFIFHCDQNDESTKADKSLSNPKYLSNWLRYCKIIIFQSFDVIKIVDLKVNMV